VPVIYRLNADSPRWPRSSIWRRERQSAFAALMARVEEEARRNGRWLLVLDTVPGENGHRLYLRAGWTQTGIIPDYALFPDGRLCDTAGDVEAAGAVTPTPRFVEPDQRDLGSPVSCSQKYSRSG
jgi:hypothetical protein